MFHHLDAPLSIIPHLVIPIVTNFRARIDACLDQLAKLDGVDDIRAAIYILIETIPSSSPNDLQAAPDQSNSRLVSIDRFIEDGRSTLGCKS